MCWFDILNLLGYLRFQKMGFMLIVVWKWEFITLFVICIDYVIISEFFMCK
jgi:hypothetical protein